MLIFCRTNFKKLDLAKSEQLRRNSANYQGFYFLFLLPSDFFVCLFEFWVFSGVFPGDCGVPSENDHCC